jgi:curved DNA-binding protein CbpA
VADKTLYEILEVSETASQDAIRAAYERLAHLWSTAGAHGATDAEAAVRIAAIKEAFFTLGNPQKRAAYDRRLASRWNTPAELPVWTFPKKTIAAALLLVAIGGGYHYHSTRQQARLEAERAIAAEKARQEVARAEAERLEAERARLGREAAVAYGEDRQRRQRDAELRALENYQRAREREIQSIQQRERYEAARLENERRREELRAAYQAQQQLARERAELCRIERARYGRAISC